MESLFRFERPRPNQEVMIKDIRHALESEEDILINAPTGIGKTDAAISAALSFALENSLDVFFLTPKMSQHKVAIESLQGIRKKFNKDIRYVDIVGKRNLCINPNVNNKEGEAFYKSCENLVSNKRCSFYTNAKDPGNMTDDLVEANYLGHNSLFNESFSRGVCAYEIVTYLAKDANFIIADYAHMLNPYTRHAFLKRIAHRLENAIIIWDEAHNILNVASSYMSSSLSTSNIISAVNELSAINSSIDLQYLNFTLTKIAEKRLVTKTEAFVESDDISKDFMSEISVVSEQLEKAGLEYLTQSKAKRSSLMHISRFLIALKEKDSSTASIISSTGKNIRMSLTCLYPEKPMELFKEPHANIFMSGTMLPLSMYRDLFGLRGAETKDYTSHFPKSNKVCVVDNTVSTKYEARSQDEYRKIAERIMLIRKEAKGNLAVFFPSFTVLTAVERSIEKKPEYVQSPEMKSVAVERLIDGFKKSKDSMLFGVMGGSLSEGIDYANNVIKGIIIVGIPLERPNLELKAKIEYINRKFNGKGNEYAYIIPGIIRAAQAAGRAIRSETDRAFIVFMDRRYGWSIYKSLIGKFADISDDRDCIDAIRAFTEKESSRSRIKEST